MYSILFCVVLMNETVELILEYCFGAGKIGTFHEKQVEGFSCIEFSFICYTFFSGQCLLVFGENDFAHSLCVYRVTLVSFGGHFTFPLRENGGNVAYMEVVSAQFFHQMNTVTVYVLKTDDDILLLSHTEKPVGVCL